MLTWAFTFSSRRDDYGKLCHSNPCVPAIIKYGKKKGKTEEHKKATGTPTSWTCSSNSRSKIRKQLQVFSSKISRQNKLSL